MLRVGPCSGESPLWGCRLRTSCILTWQEKRGLALWPPYMGTNLIHESITRLN